MSIECIMVDFDSFQLLELRYLAKYAKISHCYLFSIHFIQDMAQSHILCSSGQFLKSLNGCWSRAIIPPNGEFCVLYQGSCEGYITMSSSPRTRPKGCKAHFQGFAYVLILKMVRPSEELLVHKQMKYSIGTLSSGRNILSFLPWIEGKKKFLNSQRQGEQKI